MRTVGKMWLNLDIWVLQRPRAVAVQDGNWIGGEFSTMNFRRLEQPKKATQLLSDV